jgi:UTP--glucose-1-phosphate uridylyltransferase
MRAVVTLAGEGTRMLPWSRGLRKEFLPLYDRGENGAPVLKPVAHLVVETLIRAGTDRITVVVQPKDLAFVRHYFSVDPVFLERHRDVAERLTDTRRFYESIGGVRFAFAVQRRPAGFGDAVLQARASIGHHPFFLHAGDGALIEPDRGFLLRTMGACLERDGGDAVLLVRRVADPRRYGVVEGRFGRPFRGVRRLEVSGMVEKPTEPRSHWAATAVYAFAPSIFDALAAHRRAEHPAELELTDGVRALLARGGRVSALVLDPRYGAWRSVGSPEGFHRALARTRAAARRRAPPPGND